MSRKFRLAVLTILLAVLINKSYSIDFHVTKVIAGSQNKNIRNIVGVGANSMAIIEGSLINCTITILGGNSYDTQQFRTQEEGLISEPKFGAQEGLIVNKGYFLISKNYAKFTEYKDRNISGNIITGKQNTLFSQSRQCPTLTYLGSYNNIVTKTFGTQGTCLSYAAGYLSQYKDGYLIYAVKNTLNMLQRYNNFMVLQSYTQQPEIPQNEYSQVQTYYDEKTTELTVLARYSSNNKESYGIYQSTTNGPFIPADYELFSPTSILIPTSSLYLTGLNTAVSFGKDFLYRWQKLDGFILSMDTSTTTQPLQFTLSTCVSSDETFFIQHKADKIFVYDLPVGEKDIVKRNELTIPGIQYIVDGRVTRNNQFYVLSVMKSTKFTTFCRVNSTDMQVQCLNEKRSPNSLPQLMNMQTDSPKPSQKLGQSKVKPESMKVSVNLEGYLSISKQEHENLASQRKTQRVGDEHQYDCSLWTMYSDADLIVAACKNQTSKLVQLHLYKLSTFQFIVAQNIYLADIPAPVELKLIKNQYKQQNDPSISDRPLFLLVLKISDEYDDAVTLRYTVEGRQSFIRQNPPSYDISFQNVHAYGKFVASLKLKNATSQVNALRFFDFMTFKLVKQVPYEYAAAITFYQFAAYRNILMLVQHFGLQGVHYYDLKKFPNEDNWYRGICNNKYFKTNQNNPTQGAYIIFPKRNLQLFYRYDPTSTNQPLKQLLDIQICPIQEKIRMQDSPISHVDLYTYLKPQKQVISRQCAIVFYVAESRWLHKYEDCEDYKKSTKFDLNPKNISGEFKFDFLSESESKDNLIIKYNHIDKTKKFDIIQARYIGQPSKIVWSYNKTAAAEPLQFVNYIQTFYGTSFVRGYRTSLIQQEIEQINNSSYFELLGFDDVDAAPGCNVLCGQSQESGGYDGIIYYSTRNLGQKLYQARKTPFAELGLSAIQVKNDNVKNILISKDCSKIAALTKKYSLLVWNITQQPPKLIKSSSNINYVDIHFSGNNKIVAKTTTGAEFINLDTALSQEEGNIGVFSPQIAVSSDGQYYAMSTAPLAVDIKTTAQEMVRTFKIPIDATTKNESIISLSFTESNDLLVGLSNSQVYVLSPTPCPDPFINDNGLCICQANQTLVDNNCACRNHFTPQGNTCVCDPQIFVYQNGQCVCSANSSQVEGKCTCHDNFIQNGAFCTCPASFQYNQAKITCACPYGYVEKQECIACSFPCETCDSAGCKSYLASFYVLVIGGGVLVLAIIIGAALYIMKKKKKKNQKSELLKEQID